MGRKIWGIYAKRLQLQKLALLYSKMQQTADSHVSRGLPIFSDNLLDFFIVFGCIFSQLGIIGDSLGFCLWVYLTKGFCLGVHQGSQTFLTKTPFMNNVQSWAAKSGGFMQKDYSFRNQPYYRKDATNNGLTMTSYSAPSFIYSWSISHILEHDLL